MKRKALLFRIYLVPLLSVLIAFGCNNNKKEVKIVELKSNLKNILDLYISENNLDCKKNSIQIMFIGNDSIDISNDNFINNPCYTSFDCFSIYNDFNIYIWGVNDYFFDIKKVKKVDTCDNSNFLIETIDYPVWLIIYDENKEVVKFSNQFCKLTQNIDSLLKAND